MPAQIRPVASKIWHGLWNFHTRRLRDSGEILKFHLSAGGWDYGTLIVPPRLLNF